MNHHPDRTACFSVTCTAAKQTQGLSYPTLPGDLCRVFVKHAFSSLPLSRWNTVTHARSYISSLFSFKVRFVFYDEGMGGVLGLRRFKPCPGKLVFL